MSWKWRWIRLASSVAVAPAAWYTGSMTWAGRPGPWGQADSVGRGEAKRGALIQGEHARSGDGVPHLADGIGEEGAARADRRLGAPDLRLGHRLIAQETGHRPRRLRAGQLGEGVQAGA